MKKISLVIIMLLLVVFVSGCEETSKKEVKVNGKTINTSKMEHKHCTRPGNLEGGEVSLEYDLYYTDDILNIVKSVEKVSSDDESILNTYEEAYKGIHAHYTNLEHCETSVIRDSNSVTSTITIDYDNIDYDKIIDIEGEEDNIFENRKAKVSKWLELGKKLGVSCEKVEE